MLKGETNIKVERKGFIFGVAYSFLFSLNFILK